MKKRETKKYSRGTILVDLFNAVKSRRGHLTEKTLSLFRKNEASFCEELGRQAKWRKYSGKINLSAHDCDVGIYYNVVNRALEKKKKDVAMELLAPAVRALMTDDDAEGRAYFIGIEDAGLMCQLLWLCYEADFDDGIFAFLGAVLLKYWDSLDTELDDNDWRVIGLAATSVELWPLAATAFRTAARTDRDPERRHDVYFDASRAVLAYLRTKPRKVVECEYMVSILESCAGCLDEGSQFRVLLALAHAWMRKIKGLKGAKSSDEMFDVLARAVADYDRELTEEDSPLKSLPVAVKAPLEWQAFMAVFSDAIDRQIWTFPEPMYSAYSEKSFFPAVSHIGGVRLWDVWDGLLPKMNVNFDPALKGLLRGTEVTVSENEGMCELQTGPEMMVDYTLAQSKNRGEADISVLAVSTTGAGGKKNKNRKYQIAFPFPAKDCPDNAANTSGTVWEYYIWRQGVAADARIELKNGLNVYATLPFFAGDFKALVRGFPMTLLLAAFPLTMKKARGDAGAGTFDQECGDANFVRSAAKITARVAEVRRAALWNGTEIVRYMLRVDDLGLTLPAFVSPSVIEGDIPQVGESVECRVWLMADFREPCASFEEFRKKHPDGVEVPPVPEKKETEDKPSETFLIECHVAGTSHVDDIKGKTAELDKDSSLVLRREPGNAYDSNAIAVYTAEDNRIGYVPQKHNPVLAKLLDGGKKLIGKITLKEVSSDGVRLRIGVYLSDR